ncbi:large exoprotein [Microbacterium thalli]|uniref:Large exoprotein n=1 Tax=Microbacterium thalli TaxID=3027921 RepID=A0ABT5SHH4_9MICO|nr:large exoprotein [Microbacterium thalli]MDD7930337.1 large exoprotein [Microbacterium thalli]MDD7962279.1 large exoprotein [Microbacterium thalli]
MPDTYDGGGAGVGAFLAFFFLILPIILILALAGYLISSFFYMKIFEKAGVQGKWRAWVPVYRELVFAKLGDLSPWVMLGAFLVTAVLSNIPVIGPILGYVAIVALALASWRVGLKLGKDWPLVLLYIIPGIGGLIWLGIVAFSNAPWNPNVQPSPWRTSFLRDTTVWRGVPVQPDGGAAPAAGYGAPGAGYVPPAGGTPSSPAGAYPPPTTQTPPPSTEPPAPGAPRP